MALTAVSYVCACGAASRPPAASTVVSSANMPAKPATPIAPSIAVTDELMAACMVDIGDSAKAPRFELDKSELTDADYEVLTRLARCFDAGALSGKRIVLIGHADPRGDDQHNILLGLRRAHRVALFFEAYGIDESRIDEWTQGAREAVGTDEASWQLDRRVDIHVHE